MHVYGNSICQLYLACCNMKVSLILCVLAGIFLCPADGDVVDNFWDSPDCIKYFYNEKVPELGASLPDVVRLCHRFLNTYHFATLYDTFHRIAVYSAYIFQTSNGGGRESRWFVEPQLVDPTWPGEMEDGYKLSQQNPDIYCCVDQNGRPILSGAATALNTEQNVVVERSLDEMVSFLQQFSDAPVNELKFLIH